MTRPVYSRLLRAGLVLGAFTTSGALFSSIGGYLTVWSISAAAFVVAAIALALMKAPTGHDAASTSTPNPSPEG